jgi:UDPglucose 6-dehydrogenase
MDRRSAELTKYACNAYLATRISFVNEVACLCERLGADVELVRQGMGSDPRIGHQFLFPGIGYGGSCFPKDVRALIAMGAASDCPMGIAEAADRANDRQRRRFIERIAHRFDGDLSGRALALWGISFKPGTDDIREAPALTVANALLDRDAEIRAFDPAAAGCAQSYFGGRASIWLDMYAVLQDVDALVVMTEWPEFRNPDFELMRQAMRQPIIFDGRNLYDPKAMARLGFEYHAVGRPMEIGSLAEGGPGAEVTPLTQDAARLSLEATPGGDGQGGRGTVER